MDNSNFVIGPPPASMAPSLRLRGGGQQNKLRVGSLGCPLVARASRAVTTVAPHWRHSRRGRIQGGPTALNHAATVTLRSHWKSQHFWRMLLLVSGTADHGMILNRARPYFGIRVRSLLSCCSSAKRYQVPNFAPIAGNLRDVSKE
jgi:hypothetical protein